MKDRNSVASNGAKERQLRAEALEARRVLAAAIQANVWQPADDSATQNSETPSYIRAIDYELFTVDRDTLSQQLAAAPLEFTTAAEDQPLISIPRPDGQLETFRFVSSPVMAPELAAQFPEIQTFAGQSVTDSATNVRFDLTPAGFHAQVISPQGSYYVDPYFHLSDELYASYFVNGQFDVSDLGEISPSNPLIQQRGDLTGESPSDVSAGAVPEIAAGAAVGRLTGRSGTQLRTYRTAIAATGEYTAFHGGTITSGQAAIVTAVNRVSGIYENELSIRLELVANNSSIVYTDAATDPYTNNNAGALLGENQTNVDNVIGVANYDVGHVFSTGAGGLAALGSVGVDAIKAQGATGLPSPVGDPFFVDFVAHEFGHQFGGNHTFNGDSGACGGNRNPSTAMEPGSGSTIQAYAGICGDDDIQSNSDPFFHSISFDEMIRHVDVTIPDVGTRINTGNSIPNISTPLSFVIPASTPFVLTAEADDADAEDSLTFSWEQRDVGPQQDVSAGDNGLSPIFRAWPPTAEPSRYFPRLIDLTAGTTTIGETLPTTNRTLDFRATVRDNHLGSGGVNTSDTQLQVIDTGAPFMVTSQNAAETWDGLTLQTVTWDVAGTDVAPILSTDVTILMSTDGGMTYPFVVADRVPNAGTADIVVPNVDTTEGRIMVRGADNVFFDINDENIVVTAAPITFELGSTTPSEFIEDESPVAVAPEAVVNNPSDISLDLLSVDISVNSGFRVGDSIGLNATGTGPGQIALDGSDVSYEGTVIATMSGAAQNASLLFNSAATSAGAQAVLRAITFEHVGDNPGNQARTIDFVFGGAQTLSRTVNVVPVNDSPVVADVSLPNILEDTTTFMGTQISDLYAGPAFQDVDDLSSQAGIAIVGNGETLAEGNWYYSSDRATWRPISNIDPSNLNASLVLQMTDYLAFRPTANFFGTPAPLLVRGLDNTYDGEFSNSVSGFRIPLGPVYLQANGAASSNTANIDIEVLNVNDRPVANDSEVVINIIQDEPIDRVFPETLFTDIDSPNLDWSLSLVGTSSLPPWLSFDPITRELTGTPLNRHVGIYQLELRVTDDEPAEASIPVLITVTNVNDPPESLRITDTSIPENVVNQPVGQLFATDPDSGDQLTWTVDDSRFLIRDNQLFINSPLDFESEPTVDIRLTVTDSGLPTLSANLDVQIEVVDENEFFPELEGETFSIDDGTAAGTLLRVLNATDQDTADTITYRLSSGDVDAFTLDPNTGELRLEETADVSQRPSYRVFVEVTDSGQPPKSRVVQLNIDVTPVNNFPPQVASPQNLTTTENVAADTLLGRFLANDQDGNSLSYELLTETDQIVVDPANGELRTTAQTDFDFETATTFEAVVRVTETVAPNRTAQGVVTITITDVNDAPDGITSSNPVLTGREGYVVGGLTVSDQDPSTDYTFSTSDARFEFDNGEQLRLRSDLHIPASETGTIDIMVTVVDALDPAVSATLPLSLQIEDISPWTNRANNLDTTRDGAVVPLDALVVINALNLVEGNGELSNPRTLLEQEQPDFDTNGDGFLTPVDALLVINFLNSQNGQGEPDEQAADIALADADLWSAAFLDLELTERRRRLGRS